MTLLDLTAREQPVHKSAQRLRWFVQAFERQIAETQSQTENVFNVDRTKLASAFTDWLKTFEAQKPANSSDNPAYVGFAAGLMLKALIKTKPVEIASLPDKADVSNPAYFWPEGYLYVAFCLNIRGLVLEADYRSAQSPSKALDDARTWWSFRENTSEDPSLAIAFLDLFAGEEPNWIMPQLFKTGKADCIADRFYTKDSLPKRS